MSQLLEMLQTMGGEEELTKEGLDRPIDTTILMKSLMDSARDLTADQKTLLANGKMNLRMNMKEKVMKLDVDLPYTGYDNLQKMMSGMGNSGTGIAEEV